MDFQKAISILELKSNFTEEELKKSYRRLSMKYHPDKNKSPDAEEKMKEINAAKDYLVKYLKTNHNQKTSYQSTYNTDMYIIRKYQKLKSIVDFDFNEYKTSEYIYFIIKKIQYVPNEFDFRTSTMTIKQYIDTAFNQSLQKIKKYFKELQKEFYKEHDIDENDVKETINYEDCTLREFYQQLLKIKKQYSKDSIIIEKQKKLKDIVNFDFNKYKVSENIKNIIEKIKNVPENFISVSQQSSNKYFIENLFNVNIDTIKDYFKELQEEFYKEYDIDENDVKETINYDCTLKEFYEQLLKIKNKYSEESRIDKLLEQEIVKYTNYAGYERVKVSVRYCKTKTLNKIKANGFVYTQKDIEEMHQSILKCFSQYYSLEQRILKLESKLNEIDVQEIKYKFIKIKNKFKTTVKFDEIENSIKQLEELVDEYIAEKEKELKNPESKIKEIHENLMTRYCETLRNYNIATQSETVGNLNNFLSKVLNLFNQGIQEKRPLEFFNMFNEITFKSPVDDNKILENITKILNRVKSNIYIKTIHNYMFDDISFFYLVEKNMTMYKIQPGNGINEISSKTITQNELEEEYISLEEFLEKSTFIGENRMDGGYYGLIYTMGEYSLYLENHKFCIGYQKEFYKTAYRAYTYMDEFKDKPHLIDLIKEQIENRFKQGLNNLKPYNTDDSYGYNESRRKK